MELLIEVLSNLVNPDVLEDMVLKHPLAFIVWTALAFAGGFMIGRYRALKKSDEPAFFKLPEGQRRILFSLEDGPIEYPYSHDVAALKDMGLIAEHQGYDIFPGSTYTFVITSKGVVMLRWHPIARKRYKESDNA